MGAGVGPATSRVTPLGSDGYRLEGDAGTTAWQLVYQLRPIPPAIWMELGYTPRARLGPDPGPYGDSYVGLTFFGLDGKQLGGVVQQIRGPETGPQTLRAGAPRDAFSVAIRLFLSRPGQMEVTGVALNVIPTPDSFELLVDDMARYYSHFEKQGLNWLAHAAGFATRARAARDPAAFAEVIGEMLAPLEDLHVTIVLPDGQKRAPYQAKLVPNIDKAATAPRIAIDKRIGRLGVTGTIERYGFVAFASLMGDEAEIAAMEAALLEMTSRPGIIFDLRQNIGGQEGIAQRLVSLVTDQERVYGLVAYRAGPGFAPPMARRIAPRPGAPPYTKPIAVLIGPVCVSSCEGMALMLAALPHATLIGETTGGASANPQPIALPNGVVVWYSRWKSMQPDGTPMEGKGIAPDVPVAHQAGGDPILDAALVALKKK